MDLSDIRRFPKAGWIILLSCLAGLSQGFGIAMFIPLLELLNGETPADQFPFQHVERALNLIGFQLTLITALCILVIFIAASFVLIFIERHVILSVNLPKFMARNAGEYIGALTHARWAYSADISTGETANHLMTEMLRAGRAVTHLLAAFATAIQMVILASFSFFVSPALFSIVAAFGALIFLVIRPIQRISAASGQELSAANKRYGHQIVDRFRHLKLIKVMHAESVVYDGLDSILRHVYALMARNQFALNMANLLIQIFPVILVAIVIAVGHEVLGLATSSLLVFLILIARIAPFAARLQQEFQSYVTHLPALRSIQASINEHQANHETMYADGKQFSSLDVAIKFRDVRFAYEDLSAPAISNIDIDIVTHKMTAFVGESGAGKSTLVELLAGLRTPTEGQITVDGVPLADINLASWRDAIGYVTQDIAIFDDTLRANLMMARSDISEADLWDALKLANLDDVVQALPLGLDTRLGEGGTRLSGGQRQRIALARALVRKPQLLILDEATSSLDVESERDVQAVIRDITKTTTVVVIAHRLSSIRNADQIYVLERGRIAESGTFDQLVEQGGRFASFAYEDNRS